MAVGVGVDVSAGDGVGVDVSAGVVGGVAIGVGVAVSAGDGVGVDVSAGVGGGVAVGDGVDVAAGVGGGVAVGVGVAVSAGVVGGVAVGDGVDVAAGVGVVVGGEAGDGEGVTTSDVVFPTRSVDGAASDGMASGESGAGVTGGKVAAGASGAGVSAAAAGDGSEMSAAVERRGGGSCSGGSSQAARDSATNAPIRTSAAIRPSPSAIWGIAKPNDAAIFNAFSAFRPPGRRREGRRFVRIIPQRAIRWNRGCRRDFLIREKFAKCRIARA